MPAQSYLYRMPSGIPGAISREENVSIRPALIDLSTPPTRYGDACAYTNTGTIRPITTGDTASSIVGCIVRPYPTQAGNGWPNVNLATSTPDTPPTSGIADLMTAGYMSVKVGGATLAVTGGTVYIRVANASAGQPIGGYEAAADGGNTIVFTNAKFTGPQDAQGIGEIAVFMGP